MRWPKPRSIQQAIHCAAVFGGVALVGLFAATLLGLLGYRSAISDLDYAVHKMPRKADLAYEFSRLYQPLQLRAPTPSAKEVQKRQFLRVRRKVDTLPASRRKREGGDATHQLLFRIERSLRNLRQGAENGLATDVHDEQVRWMQRELTGLFAQIENLPQLGDTVRVPLSKSRRKYSNLLWLVMLSSGLALLVFGVLVYGGYRYISGSIREVVRGARRVAQRDFEYRIPVQYPEEMAELSGAFNMMTTRFQEAEQACRMRSTTRCTRSPGRQSRWNSVCRNLRKTPLKRRWRRFASTCE